MKLSQLYMKTYKSFPYDMGLESTKLLYRSGLIKFLEDASYSYTPMGKLFADRLRAIIKNSFEGYMDIEMASGEEKNINAYSSDIKSYKELPLNLVYESKYKNSDYKFKDGLLNPKSDKMMKFLSFADEENAAGAYSEAKEKLMGIFKDAGIDPKCLEEGDKATFMLYTDYPLKSFMSCANCGYGGEADELRPVCLDDLSTEEELEMEEVYTPSVGSISDLESFFGSPASMFIKTLLFDVKGEIVAVLLRGDKSINIRLLAEHIGVDENMVQMANESQVREATSADAGFAGPIGLKAGRIFCDEQVLRMKNAVVGANRTDYHIKNVNINRDFKPEEVGIFRMAEEGDVCPVDKAPLKTIQGSCLAQVKISQADSKYLNEEGKEKELFEVSAYVNLDRVMAATVEKNRDDMGILWPKGHSPFEYYIIIGNAKKEEEVAAGEKIYDALLEKGLSAILDDRKERIGSKFKDSELLGIEKVIVAGKLVSEGKVELKNRKTSEKEDVEIEQLLK
ncbi:prolyl-tRNA synthetase [Peptoclostridium litorale DSM 5388]|uniref:Proline--tRNA ligase ProS n=1 Tax=Peptoclostridium litorale DSM 5388 TaxID=1121324 RepID=A0A069RB85_PEPLI|nr:YbaK/EbsC family protein [Peptoclostridium litorale]KDR94329.1 proline--tRNA ligase ProS [Peptoclostridium litorale DSM 5388]SIO29102.1 prolyl-tRNA synthetase [Peptoclostridium litorale DSM 5388]